VTPLPPICLTGASGFIGRRVTAQLASAGANDVTLLLRDPTRLAQEALPSSWRLVRADLSSDTIPPGALVPGAVVLHLAAATGTANAAQMQRLNVDATGRLLAAAKAAGARHFVFVSSVSAGYPDQRWAEYPQSKARAERLVAAAGVPYTIVRPTMVFGPGSPNQQGLEKLATLAVPLLPGQGDVRAQPIHVDDIAKVLLYVAALPAAVQGHVTVGGPSVLTMRNLFAAIRHARGLAARAPITLPLGALRSSLALLGALAGALLPVSAGQFVVFANDAVAQPAPRGITLPAAQVSLEAMLAEPAHA
jgi:nucleoside-diphosphate-sugar epimerase